MYKLDLTFIQTRLKIIIDILIKMSHYQLNNAHQLTLICHFNSPHMSLIAHISGEVMRVIHHKEHTVEQDLTYRKKIKRLIKKIRRGYCEVDEQKLYNHIY